MDDPKENARRENFIRQVAESNAYHQKKLQSPEEVSNRLNYQDKKRRDPNSPFKGHGRRIGFSPPQPPSPPPRQSHIRNSNPPKPTTTSNTNIKPKRINSIPQHQNFQQPQKQCSQIHHPEIKKPQFKGIGQVVGSTKSKGNQISGILPPQSSPYHNQQGAEMRTWHNILNDPMDEKQTKILSLINQFRARSNKSPLAFSRSCTAQIQDQVEKAARNEIKLESFHDGLQERAEKIPRCKKANEIFASVSKINEKSELEIKTTSTTKQQQIKSTVNPKPNSTVKSTSKAKSTPYSSNLSGKRTQINKTKKYDPVQAIFDKWMEKSTMRTTVLGNYQVIGIVFADSNDGSSMIGAAIFAQIS